MSESASNNENTAAEDTPKLEEKAPVTSTHTTTYADGTLDYTATVGFMPIKNEKEEVEAEIFYMAYTLNDVADSAERPLMFVFNGGPGSSSVWLHLGAVGPKRVRMGDEGFLPPAPYRLEDNAYTWLDLADLVFIDPVGTGYSHAAKSDDNQKYWSLDGDLKSVGEFIRMYLSRNSRWSSPLFLAGESYGTTRATGLSNHLIDRGIALNGIVLVSTVMDFQTLRFAAGHDLPYFLYVTAYAATAWYHQQLADDLQAMALTDFLREVETWSEDVYVRALALGDKLPEDEKQAVITQLARYTGLSERYVAGANMRIHIMRFCKELRRDEKRSVGRLDSRFVGINRDAVAEFPEFDPSYSDIIPPYTAMFNQYIRAELQFETDRPYEILSFNVNQSWEWPRGETPNTGEHLRSALAKNKHMKVFVGQGYYDLATPYFAAEYSFNHLQMDDEVRNNVDFAYYEAGHMMYLHLPSLEKLKADVKGFVENALPSA